VLAVDTNVIIRLLTGDEPAQSPRARAIFERETLLISKTVLLESEWVLRSLYRFARGRVTDALARLIALPNVVCEDAAGVADAIGLARKGLDFADAFHLASARSAGRFATFDRKLAKAAGKIADLKIELA
jgi:predicted nucleic acid-binding protein